MGHSQFEGQLNSACFGLDLVSDLIRMLYNVDGDMCCWADGLLLSPINQACCCSSTSSASNDCSPTQSEATFDF